MRHGGNPGPGPSLGTCSPRAYTVQCRTHVGEVARIGRECGVKKGQDPLVVIPASFRLTEEQWARAKA